MIGSLSTLAQPYQCQKAGVPEHDSRHMPERRP